MMRFSFSTGIVRDQTDSFLSNPNPIQNQNQNQKKNQVECAREEGDFPFFWRVSRCPTSE